MPSHFSKVGGDIFGRLCEDNNLVIDKSQIIFDKIVYAFLSESCYVTTACVEQMGLPDNCEELQTLRGVRRLLEKSTEGLILIRLYDVIAPNFVKVIKQYPDSNEILEYSFHKIKEGISHTHRGQPMKTVNSYIKLMVELDTILKFPLKKSVNQYLLDNKI